MVGAFIRRRSLVIAAVVLGLVAYAVPSFAQTGQVKGRVVDAQNKPVEGARVTIELIEGMTRKFETKTDRRGNFIQIGLSPGMYRITAEKDGLAESHEVRVRLDMSEVNFVLKPAAAGPGEMSKEERAKAEKRIAAIRATFEEGVALSNAGNFDEAIAKFNEVLAEAPGCTECHSNIAAVYVRKKEFDLAEAEYKKSIAIKPTPEAYNGLATVYNAQKKFEQAQAASAEARKLAAASGAAGDASTLFNQGVIAWNAGQIADAKQQFEEAVRIDPKMADARYWLGMANLNEGNLTEAVQHFEEYLKLAPTGQYAEQAKGILSQIKK